MQDDRQNVARVLDGEEIEGVLSGSYYRPQPIALAEQTERTSRKGEGPESGVQRVAKGGEKPLHYKVICISMYMKDLERLDDLVDQLKARGLTKANRSALIRAALDQVDLDKVPRGI